MRDKFVEYPLTKGKKIAILLVYFLGFMLLFQIGIALIFNALKITNNLFFMFSIYLLTAAILVGLARDLFRKERDLRMRDLMKAVGVGVGLLLLVNLIFGGLIQLLFSLQTSANQEGLSKVQDLNPGMYFVTVAMLAPLVEEIVFRGVIFRVIRARSTFLISAIISGVAFGFLHVFDSLFTGNYIDLVYIVLYGAMGVIFAKAYEDTGSIYACVILHGAYNALGFFLSMM